MFHNGVDQENNSEPTAVIKRSYNRNPDFFSSLRKRYSNQAHSIPQNLPYINNKLLLKSLSIKQPKDQHKPLKKRSDLASLLDLPLETIDDICHYLLDSPKTLAALAGTCSTLLNLMILKLDDEQGIPFFPLLEIIRQGGIKYCYGKAGLKLNISENEIFKILNPREKLRVIESRHITPNDIAAVIAVLEKDKRNKELVSKYGHHSSSLWKIGCTCMCINLVVIYIAGTQYSITTQDGVLILTLLSAAMYLAALCIPLITCDVVIHRDNKFKKEAAFLNIRNNILSRNAPQPQFIRGQSSDEESFAEDDNDDFFNLDTSSHGWSNLN